MNEKFFIHRQDIGGEVIHRNCDCCTIDSGIRMGGGFTAV